MLYLAALAFAGGLAVPIAVLSAAGAQGRAAAAALEGIARQPEAAGEVRSTMLLALGMIESLVIFSLVVFIMLYFRLPDTATIVTAITKGVGG